ncbi:unnamed protein product, partial [Thlaspi arvense]
MVKSALKPGLLYLIRDLKGVHVIKRCLRYLGPDDNQFVIEAATRFCAKIATHNHGCSVLKQCVEYSVGEQREKLVDEISRNSLHLAQDPFGNYLVQFIIKQKLGGINVMSEFKGGYVKLATQKFSSHRADLRSCDSLSLLKTSNIFFKTLSLITLSSPLYLTQRYSRSYIVNLNGYEQCYIRKSLVDKVRRCEHVRMNAHCRKIFFKSHLLKM